MTSQWEILDGLPVYGPMAEPFSATGQGTHREGLVVRFSPPGGSWVGNFQRGLSSLDHVFDHPNGRHVVVVAGGTAYVVDAPSHHLVEHFGGQIVQIIPLSDSGPVLLGNGLWFTALDANGIAWRTRRISWDGFRRLSLVGTTLRGEAYAPFGEGTWHAFELDTSTGAFTGGAYRGPE